MQEQTEDIFKASVFGEGPFSWGTAGEQAANARWQGFLDSFAEYGEQGFCLWCETSVAPFEQTIADLKNQGLSDGAILIFETAHWHRLKALIEPWMAANCRRMPASVAA